MRIYKLNTNEISDKLNPQWSEIQYCIDILSSVDGTFITLEADPRVDAAVYMQAVWRVPRGVLFKKNREKPHYTVEVQLVDTAGALRQFAYDTIDQYEVEALFAAYLNDARPPVINGWRDITDEVL